MGLTLAEKVEIISKEIKENINMEWVVSFREQGLGHGDYGIITKKEKLIAEYLDRELAEYIVEIHNKCLEKGQEIYKDINSEIVLELLKITKLFLNGFEGTESYEGIITITKQTEKMLFHIFGLTRTVIQKIEDINNG